MRWFLLSTLFVGCELAVGSSAEFEPPVRLTAEGIPVRVESPGYAAPCWADINGDGKLDVLVGDCVTLISPAKGLSEKEFKKRYAAWQESFTNASQHLNSTSGDEKAEEQARERFQKVYDDRSEFMNEDRTGFVWLYLQK